jgi:hypothetical protein
MDYFHHSFRGKKIAIQVIFEVAFSYTKIFKQDIETSIACSK